MGNTTWDELSVKDIVFSKPEGDYGCLVGRVISIIPLGSPEHDTGNETDDIHVDFFAPYSLLYSDNRKAEIEREFSSLYGKPVKYDELPLDDVIMAPESLVRLNGIGTWDMTRLLKSRSDAEAYFSTHLSDSVKLLHEQLMGRVDKNFTEYRSSLHGFGKQELIDMAGKISAMSDAHSYMTTWHDFNLEELEFYLRFKNPLEVVAEDWRDRNSDLCEMSYTMDYINENMDDFINQYPLIDNAEIAKPNEPEQSSTAKKPSLTDKLRSANEKAKAQDAHNNIKSHIREERG